jgi:hypothetical protein
MIFGENDSLATTEPLSAIGAARSSLNPTSTARSRCRLLSHGQSCTMIRFGRSRRCAKGHKTGRQTRPYARSYPARRPFRPRPGRSQQGNPGPALEGEAHPSVLVFGAPDLSVGARPAGMPLGHRGVLGYCLFGSPRKGVRGAAGEAGHEWPAGP